MASRNAPKHTPESLEELRTLALKAIAEAPAPIKAPDLAKRIATKPKVTGATVTNLLSNDLAANRIFAWGKAYWNRDQSAAARERLLDLTSTNIVSRPALVKQAAALAPPIPSKIVTKALTEEKRLRECGSKPKVVVDVDHPEPYLTAEINKLLRTFGREQPSEKILGFLDADRPKPPDGDAAEKLYAALNRIASEPGTTVTFFRLRQQPELADIPKQVFDQAALQLQHDRRALLNIHDHAAALPPEERDRFVADGQGRFYVSIYAR